MHVSDFLAHWGLSENPFTAEEARHDAIFARLKPDDTTHPDFGKILGALDRPSTSIVFGEKGSGKTALRLQIAQRITRWNDLRPDRSVLFVAYDDANPFLDRFVRAAARPSKRAVRRHARDRDQRDPLEAFSLADHMDAILRLSVTQFVDALLANHKPDERAPTAAERLRDQPVLTRQNVMLLQSLYDDPSRSLSQRRAMRRRIKAPRSSDRFRWRALAAMLWILPVWLAYMRDFIAGWDESLGAPVWLTLVFASAGLWLGVMGKAFVWDRWRPGVAVRRLSHTLRVLSLDALTLRESLAALPRSCRIQTASLITDPLDARYDMFDRLRSALRGAGFMGAVVVVDRVDEPVMIAGDAERMRSFIWPLFNNKFLQMDSVGFKLLLPIELRHSLMRETTAFFQEARLDKQAFIEQLSWTGATLYDLCNARLRAARAPGQEGKAPTLQDLFDNDVDRQDIVDALDQMRQPRDAFKMLYQCVQEHCARITSDAPVWRVPRHVLDMVRRLQAERVQMLARGVRPA